MRPRKLKCTLFHSMTGKSSGQVFSYLIFMIRIFSHFLIGSLLTFLFKKKSEEVHEDENIKS